MVWTEIAAAVAVGAALGWVVVSRLRTEATIVIWLLVALAGIWVASEVASSPFLVTGVAIAVAIVVSLALAPRAAARARPELLAVPYWRRLGGDAGLRADALRREIREARAPADEVPPLRDLSTPAPPPGDAAPPPR